MPGTCVSAYNQTNLPSVVNILAGTLSLFGSAFVLAVYSFIKKKENVSQLILSLTAADLLASFFILLSHILILGNYYGNVLCILLRSFIELFFIASALWTSCIAFHLCLEVSAAVSNRLSTPKYDRFYHLVCWGVPVAMNVIITSAGYIVPDTSTKWCHLEPLQETIFWFAPITLCIIWNVVFYLIIIRKVSRIIPQSLGGGKIILHFMRRLGLLFFIFILCWCWDIWNHFAYYWFGVCPPDWMLVLQDFFSPLQGFLNSLLYGLSSKEFQKASAQFLAKIPFIGLCRKHVSAPPFVFKEDEESQRSKKPLTTLTPNDE